MNLRTFAVSAAVAGLMMGLAGAAAAAEDGEKVFKKCRACHSTDAGKNMVGPSLSGVVGRQAATAPGYTRYKGLKGADWKWTEALLTEYLANPSKFTLARTKTRSTMILSPGLTAEESAAVIAYLKGK